MAKLKKTIWEVERQVFANFIRQHFNLCFARAGPKRDGKRILVMDNDPSHVSKVAMRALEEIEGELF